MTTVLVPLAPGFEELEAVTIVDVLRRADIEVRLVSLGPERLVTGSHGISLLADEVWSELGEQPVDAIALPGGMPGSRHLRDHLELRARLVALHAAGGLVAALCAAPIVLDAAGLLTGRRATAFPGTELPSAVMLGERVVVDGRIVTSRGPGTALEFALTLVAELGKAERAAELRAGMLVSPG